MNTKTAHHATRAQEILTQVDINEGGRVGPSVAVAAAHVHATLALADALDRFVRMVSEGETGHQ